MKVIVLSAGQGKRLLPLTANRPKCALLLGERSVLGWQLQALAAAGATEAVVVTGFRAQAIKDSLGAGIPPQDPTVQAQTGAEAIGHAAGSVSGLPVRTAHNPFYAHCDNLGTCWIIRHEMTDPFVIVNGDTLFEPEVFARLLACDDAHPITLVTNHKDSYDDDDMKVSVANGQLKRVDKKLPPEEVDGESIGMIRFQGPGPALFRGRLEAMMAEESTLKRWYLSAIDALAAEGHVGVATTGSYDWCEIDDHKDLEHAKAVVPKWFAG